MTLADVPVWMLPVVVILLGFITHFAAGWMNRGAARITAEVERMKVQQTAQVEVAKAQTTAQVEAVKAQQSAEEKFRDDLLARVSHLQALYDEQGKLLYQQGVELAELRGEVRAVRATEERLKNELAHARAEVVTLRQEKAELDFENQAQAQKLAELGGRLVEQTVFIAELQRRLSVYEPQLSPENPHESDPHP